MKEEDIPKIVEIYKSVNLDDAKIIRKVYTRFYKNLKRKKFVKDYLLVEGKDVIAFSGFNKEQTETKDIFWLNWTGVKENFRHQGKGTLLLKHIFSEVKKLGGRKIYVSSSTQKEYKNSLKFYRSLGFKLEGRLKDYYGLGVDSLMFGKKL